MTIGQIERLTDEYADAMGRLAGAVEEAERIIEDVKRRHKAKIKNLLSKAVDGKSRLRDAIDGNRVLFEKPKTFTFSGIRVGLKKEKGSIVVLDEGKTIKRIRAMFDDRADALIKTKETLIKDALSKLPADTLKKLGVTVESDTEAVYIKDVGTEVERLVNALFEGLEEEIKEVS